MEQNDLFKRLNEEVEKNINSIVEEGIKSENFERLYKLVDISKDIANIKYWKEDNMRYGTYGRGSYGAGNYNGYGQGSYGRRGVAGTGRYREGGYSEGSYNAGGNYGRRGIDAKYRGEEMLNDMYEGYQEYSEGKEMYGADNDTLKSFEYMLKSFKDYYKHLKQEASSQEEVQMLEKTAKEIGMM